MLTRALHVAVGVVVLGALSPWILLLMVASWRSRAE